MLIDAARRTGHVVYSPISQRTKSGQVNRSPATALLFVLISEGLLMHRNAFEMAKFRRVAAEIVIAASAAACVLFQPQPALGATIYYDTNAATAGTGSGAT